MHSHADPQGGLLQIDVAGHFVTLISSHVGIEITAGASSDAVVESDLAKPLLLSKYPQLTLVASKDIIVGVDAADPLKGLTLKLFGFARLLGDQPARRGTTALVQVVTSSSNDEFLKCLRSLAADINEQFPNSVVLIEEHLSSTQMAALFSMATVLLDTSVRHGLSLVPFEFIRHSRPRNGIFVSSEFIACSRVLPGSTRCNPWDPASVADALEGVLSLREPERSARYCTQREFVSNNTVLNWLGGNPSF